MLRVVSNQFDFSFRRGGGSLVIARIDVWEPTAERWEFRAEFKFSNSVTQIERARGQLPPGRYTCVFQCFVEESLNGHYEFELAVDVVPTFVDSGDVNTTAAKNDSKVFKDQFVLEVRAVNPVA